MMVIVSEYASATDEVNKQCDEINAIIKKYDNTAMLIGEAPCTKDLIEITDVDFKNVSIISIAAIFIIILLTFKSFHFQLFWYVLLNLQFSSIWVFRHIQERCCRLLHPL